MKLFLEKVSNTQNGEIPYQLRVEMTSLISDLEHPDFRIPIYRYTNGKDMYNAEVCGFRVVAEETEELTYLVDRLLRSLVNMSRLPTYVFIARRSRQMYPVYTIQDEVLATTPGGPVFRHVELAKVRDYLSHYLHEVGALGTPGKSDKLHVRGVNMDSLALNRPIFYLKKRAQHPGENEFWAPVFLADDKHSIYTYAASGKREVELSGGYEALLLRSQVAQALIADKRLIEDYDLRPDRLRPRYWARVKATLEPHPAKLVYGDTTFDLYSGGRSITAVEYRQDEDRYSLYIGHTLDDLRQRTAQDLVRRGLISSPDEMYIKEETKAAA